MADSVYASTTAPNPKSKCFLVPTEILDLKHFSIKVAQVVLSLVAFLQEELVTSCVSCGPLYFFEFLSCSSFLFTLLLLLLLSTSLHQRVGVSTSCWNKLDFFYTAAIFFLFFIASIVFIADNNGSALEKSAAVFGLLASLLFLVDLVLVIRSRGFPWKPAQNLENPPNGPTGPPGPPEAERLNENGA
ncbi:CKLF-like MARVEL transmembrane domain-containing protein 6 [Eucyclogobius newberryi]|uniref:CKLF-like MARVEL transmembrane domain-containing protein 6 n=1 Tax=Eucyclogobius newberryi TaxID=166745 RepID=UPI003B5B96F8